MIQPGCHKAKVQLVRRIKISANRAGISTVRDMARQSGVSKSGVDKIYRLNSFPTFDTLLALAQACETTVHEWTADLEQDKESKGQKPEKGDEANPIPDSSPADSEPKPAKPEKANPIPDNGSKGPQPEKAKPVDSNPIPDEPPEKHKPSNSFVDVVAMLKGVNPQ